MAYVSASLNLVVPGQITTQAGSRDWVYMSTDSPTLFLATSYFSDGVAKGLSKGDVIYVIDTTTPAFFMLQVSAVTSTAATAVARNGSIGAGQLAAEKFTSISAGNGTFSAGDMEGARWVNLASSGATAMTTRTAAQLIAAIPNMQIGDTYHLHIFNSNGGTLTLTGGTGVTITGTATIATNITRDYMVSMTGAATITMQNLGAGVAS